MKSIVVTGGAGYIGSHVCKAVAAQGWLPVVVDNLSTGFERLALWGDLIRVDVRDTPALTTVLERYRPDAVVHMAASAYVGDSMKAPLEYYSNNVTGMQSLLRACVSADVKAVVFSSSCATYGIPAVSPVSEDTPTVPVSPYGETKLVCERLLHWCGLAHQTRWIALRYFNAAGADPDGLVGELHDPETHLVPLILRATGGSADALLVHGSDYATRDGTAVRDYVHVSDLAAAHVSAVDYLAAGGAPAALNLGSGAGHSILEVIASVERVTGRTVNYRFGARRHGDPPELWAGAAAANRTLGWFPKFTHIDDIVGTAWRWACANGPR